MIKDTDIIQTTSKKGETKHITIADLVSYLSPAKPVKSTPNTTQKKTAKKKD